jgi:hypothetical protein
VATSPRHNSLEKAIKAFSLLFVLEVLVLLIAKGGYFAGPTSHLRYYMCMQHTLRLN